MKTFKLKTKVISGKFALLVLLMIILNSCQKEDKSDTNVNLFDDEHMHVVKLISYQSDMWKNLEEDKKFQSEKEITNYQSCKIEIDGNTLDSIGVRFKGESSYDFQTNKKKSFKIEFGRFIKKQKYQGLQKISLNNQFRDPTFMREKLMLDIIASEGLPVSRSSYCKVYFNDEYLGLYLLVEEIGKGFLKKNFTHKSGNLYNGKPLATLKIPTDSITALKRCYRRNTNKKSKDFSDLDNLIQKINSNEPESVYVKNLNAVFNTEDCLKLWAINNFFVNVDAYNLLYPHNYFLYFDKAKLKDVSKDTLNDKQKKKKDKKKKKPKIITKTTGKANWIGYDYNYAFGGWSPKFTLKQIYNFDILYVNTPAKDVPLAQKLLKDISTYRKFYLNYLNTLLTKKIESGWVDDKIESYYDLIKDDVYNDVYKLSSSKDFELNLEETIGDKNDPGAFTPGLNEFINNRKEAVKTQLEHYK